MKFKADLGLKVPSVAESDFLKKLPYVSENLDSFELDREKRDCVSFTLKISSPAEAATVAERILEVANKMFTGFQESETKVLVNHRNRKVPFSADPHPALIARGELFPFGNGRYGLGPDLCKLVRVFDDGFRKMAEDFGAPAYQFPSVIGGDALVRCKYISQFPHSLCLVQHLCEDLPKIKDFAATAKWADGHLEFNQGNLAKAEVLLAPSVCFHYYAGMQDTKLDKEVALTAIGKCFRFESKNMSGLERLWDFSMREIIFVGSEAHVVAQRDRGIELVTALFEEWEINYDVSQASDPFFIDTYKSQIGFQKSFDLKYEIQASLPYKKGSLAVGSINFHQNFFGRSFGITDVKGEPAFSACVAFGMERLLLAFLAQYGSEPRHWPKSIGEKWKAL